MLLCWLQLIRVCADHGDAVSALGVYEWMRAPSDAGGAGLQPTAYTYTATMRAALGVGMLDRAMQVSDVTPNVWVGLRSHAHGLIKDSPAGKGCHGQFRPITNASHA
jgi:hypothetical protein